MCDGHDYRWIGACAFGVSSLDELSFRSDKLYIHGSRASRMLQSLSGGADACVTVTIIDGLVLARSAFHHSMNYRSDRISFTFTVLGLAGCCKVCRAVLTHV